MFAPASQKLKMAGEALLTKITEVRIMSLPAVIEFLKPSQIDLFGKALAKGYLNLLVGKIALKGYKAIIKGGHAALAHAMHK